MMVNIPFPELKEVMRRIGLDVPTRKRDAVAKIDRWLERQHQKAIDSAPDASWQPPSFDEYKRDWIKTNFGR